MDDARLRERIGEIAGQARLAAVAVAVRAPGTERCFTLDGGRWCHAASTYKAALLLVLLHAAAHGRLALTDRLQVRNRFRSVLDGAPYRIERDRDGDESVHRQVGRAMSLRDLAEKMITRSSNLATNLLLDFLTLEEVHRVLELAEVPGLAIRRGVEDLAAFDAGIVNEATAEGLVALFAAFLRPGFLPEPLREEGMAILLAQEFNSMLPARLPKGVRVAHKTGEISTHCHDAGIVFPPHGAPYLVAILTECDPAAEGRQRAVAEISRAIYSWVTGEGSKP